jgi:nucleotide-binding universal stress UspA family protein
MHVLPEVPKELDYSGGAGLLFGYGPGFSGVPPTLKKVRQEDLSRDGMIADGRQKAKQMAKDHVKSLIYKFRNQEPDAAIQSENIIIRLGNPVECILEEIKAKPYDLIVLGRRGHGKLKGPRTGGVAQWVLNRSPIPVLIVGKDAQ